VTVLRPVTACTPAEALRSGAARGMLDGYDAVIELSVEHFASSAVSRRCWKRSTTADSCVR
jgi:hypothetical protein